MRSHGGKVLGSRLWWRPYLSLSPPTARMTTAGLMTKAFVWSAGPVLQRPQQSRQRLSLYPVALAHPDVHYLAPAGDGTDHETDRWID